MLEVVGTVEHELETSATRNDRRAGDPATLICDTVRARILAWRPEIDQLDDIGPTAWASHQKASTAAAANIRSGTT